MPSRLSYGLFKNGTSRLPNLLKKKYPDAFKAFLSIDEKVHDNLMEFFNSFNVILVCRETTSSNPNLKGTYIYQISIGEKNAKKLNRKSLSFTYHGIKSQQAALEKGIEKSFQIIQCLLTDRTLPEQVRYR